jgi:hypothetical protein
MNAMQKNKQADMKAGNKTGIQGKHGRRPQAT